MCMCLRGCVCVYVSRFVAQPNIFYWALLAALFIIRNNNSLHIFFFRMCVVFCQFPNKQRLFNTMVPFFSCVRSLSWYCRSYDTLYPILYKYGCKDHRFIFFSPFVQNTGIHSANSNKEWIYVYDDILERILPN